MILTHVAVEYTYNMSKYLILYLIIGGICSKYFPRTKAPSTTRSTRNSYGGGMHPTSIKHCTPRSSSGLPFALNGGSASLKEAVTAMISTGSAMSSTERILQVSRRTPSLWPKSTSPISSSFASSWRIESSSQPKQSARMTKACQIRSLYNIKSSMMERYIALDIIQRKQI